MSIKDYWIEKIQNIEEFKAIAEVVELEMAGLNNEISNMLDDQFIMDATDKGIARREKILNIQPFADDTFESRRFRIGVNWNNQLPYSFIQLQKKLSDLVGENGYTMILDYGMYTMTIRIALGVKRMLQDADKMVRNISPCNLLITVDLLYNKYSDLVYYTYKQLMTKTYFEIREEVLY